MDSNKLVGIVLIVLGALLLLGWLSIPFLAEIVGIALVVLGILMLMGKMAGGQLIGIIAIALGALILLGKIPAFADMLKDIWRLVLTVIAVLLIVFGVLKVLGKR